jgi:hypothetical protein
VQGSCRRSLSIEFPNWRQTTSQEEVSRYLAPWGRPNGKHSRQLRSNLDQRTMYLGSIKPGKVDGSGIQPALERVNKGLLSTERTRCG